MYPRRITSFVAISLLVVACSTPGSSGAPSSGGEASTEPGASQGGGPGASQGGGGGGGGGGGASLATADLTITGGDYAGHYVVDLVEAGGCSTGVVGPGSFAVASNVVEPADAFGGPQISIYDAAAAAGGTDSQFSAAFPFNNYAYTVEINPYLSETQGGNFGSGTATVTDRGSTATVTIEGTSASGETVSATIECHQVANY